MNFQWFLHDFLGSRWASQTWALDICEALDEKHLIKLQNYKSQKAFSRWPFNIQHSAWSATQHFSCRFTRFYAFDGMQCKKCCKLKPEKWIKPTALNNFCLEFISRWASLFYGNILVDGNETPKKKYKSEMSWIFFAMQWIFNFLMGRTMCKMCERNRTACNQSAAGNPSEKGILIKFSYWRLTVDEEIDILTDTRGPATLKVYYISYDREELDIKTVIADDENNRRWMFGVGKPGGGKIPE